MAVLASMGDAEISSKAIAFDNDAILIADKLASSDNVKERRAAKEVLIRAHLNIAQEIAAQPYNNKLQSISEWLNRASGLAEDYIAHDGGSLEWRLLVAQQALGALASFKADKDPAPWVAEAQQAADALMEQFDDQLWQQQIEWEAGVAYFHATQIEHTRMKTAAALRYGQLAIENLAEGAKLRQATPECEQLVGRLYFYIGAVHAIHNLDHEKAVLWYDRAAPLLTAPRPVSELMSPRRDGEELVSMGLSYWKTGQRERALELSKAGTALIEQSVDDKILDKSALAVPYSNLASMFKQQGDASNAAKYAELARSASAAKRANRNMASDGRADHPGAAGQQFATADENGQPADDQPCDAVADYECVELCQQAAEVPRGQRHVGAREAVHRVAAQPVRPADQAHGRGRHALNLFIPLPVSGEGSGEGRLGPSPLNGERLREGCHRPRSAWSSQPFSPDSLSSLRAGRCFY